MLLEFSFENYKTFYDKTVLSMLAAPRQRGLLYSIRKVREGRHDHRVLCSSVIYGPNASGKTGIVGAFEAFKAIVLRGHVRDAESREALDKAAYELSLIPTRGHAEKPVTFSVKFSIGQDIYEYGFSVDVGKFLDKTHHRAIVKEWLNLKGEHVFNRSRDGVSMGEFRKTRDLLQPAFLEDPAAATRFAGNLPEDELFLSSSLKTLVSAKIADAVLDWFRSGLTVVYRANEVSIVPPAEFIPEGRAVVDQSLQDALQEFGVTANAVGYLRGKNDQTVLGSILESVDGAAGGVVLPAMDYESLGTVRFANMLPLVRASLANGSVLVIDEFDASIHPMAIMSLINVYHNDEVNTKGAQLIFNTHNPIFLNRNLFRRDEIKFVDRSEETGCSELYSLSDFGTAGANGVRNSDDYMKNYFVNRYGAIKNVDFTSALKSSVPAGD